MKRQLVKATQSHYESHSAQSYESAFFYEPGAYMLYLSDLAKNYILLNGSTGDKRRILDIGGGTGNFTRMIVKGTDAQAVIIDPFLEQHDATLTSGNAQVISVKAPAEAFLDSYTDGSPWWRRDYHQVLLKEVVHHFRKEDRIPIFRGLWNGLVAKPGLPSLLIITRPQHDIDYPLWDEARKVWAQNQPAVEELVDELEQGGFCNVRHSLESYPCNIELTRWQSMVKARFWSTFSDFTDEELEQACVSIQENETNQVVDGKITFDDRLLFILADK
jgi:cyclopropane fatty-acyl-phospholipid synthase-like methyltransferase